MNRIVVGVDGSLQSRRALRWAAQEAKLRGARLSVIHAYTLPHLGAEQALTTEVIRRIRTEAQDLVAAGAGAACDPGAAPLGAGARPGGRAPLRVSAREI